MLLVTQPEGESAAQFPQAPGCVLNIYTFSILLLLFMAWFLVSVIKETAKAAAWKQFICSNCSDYLHHGTIEEKNISNFEYLYL